MGDKQRRDYGSGSISQRKDGTWTARMIIGTNEAGNPRIKAFYGKSEREVKKKMKEFEKELHKNDGTVVQKNTVETYMRNWLYSVKSNELKPKSFDRLERTIVYQVIPHIGNLQIAAIQADDVQKMLNTLKAEGKSYSTIKKASYNSAVWKRSHLRFLPGMCSCYQGSYSCSLQAHQLRA